MPTSANKHIPTKPRFSLVLVSPQIAGNTGAIGRTCVALGLRLILIRPYGFTLDEKALRRAGLDYWKHVDLREYDSWQDFIMEELPEREQLLFFSKKATVPHYLAKYHPNGYLVFGNETKGLPEDISADYADCLHLLPMYSDKVRSLNLSNAATAATYEAIRQLYFK